MPATVVETCRSTGLAPDPAAARAEWPGFVAVDEGLDQLFRWEPEGDRIVWTAPLATKCRSLQILSAERVLGVTDQGYFEADLRDGRRLRTVGLARDGVISVTRLPAQGTFVGGLNLGGQCGLTFLELDSGDRPRRQVVFPGDYLRRSVLTSADTILFANNSRVLEGDWSGRILREFAAPRFEHAWKAQRLANEHTLISAGYGAFLVEFDGAGRPVRRWEAGPGLPFLRPHFFADFTRRDDGSVVVCNWLGHGANLGGTGFPLLEFDPAGKIVRAWQDAERTSSIQTFVLLEPGAVCAPAAAG